MVGMLSDIGNSRQSNQDYIGKYEDSYKRLYIVADGMGGHNAGEIASKTAVEKIIEYIGKKQIVDNPSKVLVDAVKYANEKVFHLACEKESYNGMGTTVTACLLIKDQMVVANVGDSRCYIINKQGILKITKDHSLVQQLIDNGAISYEEAVNHPNRNVITRAVGTKYSVKVDTFSVNLKDVNKILLCTDGLTKEMEDKEILQIVKEISDDQLICTKLVEKCKIRGANDNISVIVFEGECK